jgi:uncharacterized membrane protein HdeD (DUF308 family)
MKLVLFILLALIFLGCSAANADVLVAFVRRRQHGSMTPLMGGLSGFTATLIAPWQAIHNLWWLALLLDAGTGYWLIMLFVPRRPDGNQ